MYQVALLFLLPVIGAGLVIWYVNWPERPKRAPHGPKYCKCGRQYWGRLG